MRTRDNKLTFSIRKLTIGAVSVMFGALIFGVSTSQAKADTVDSNQTTAQVQSDKQDSQEQDQDATQAENTQKAGLSPSC